MVLGKGAILILFCVLVRYKIILPAAKEWSLVINFIRWSDRLQFNNHHPMFPTLFTTLWDTTCNRIQEPRNCAVARYTCNGHYDFPCYLVLLGITFTGMLVFYSGQSIGPRPMIRISSNIRGTSILSIILR